MTTASRNPRRILMWLLLLTLFAALVYAGAELMGQANMNCADAGFTGAGMEMASLESIKPSKAAPAKASESQRLLNKIKAVDREYQSLVKKARSETVSSGHVSEGTRSAGLACAGRYQQASDAYAAYWEKNGNTKRAVLAREAGLSRVKNAEMTFNDVDSSRISAYNDQQEKLAAARKAYLEEAKTDVSDADRAAIKSSLQPRLEAMAGEVKNLISSLTSLRTQVRGQAGGGIGAIGGCAKQAVTSGASGGVGGLLSPVTNLLSLAKSMGSNVTGMLSELASL